MRDDLELPMQCYRLGEGGGDVVSPLLTPPSSILFQFCLGGGCWLPSIKILDHRPSILMTVSGTPACCNCAPVNPSTILVPHLN